MKDLFLIKHAASVLQAESGGSIKKILLQTTSFLCAVSGFVFLTQTTLYFLEQKSQILSANSAVFCGRPFQESPVLFWCGLWCLSVIASSFFSLSVIVQDYIRSPLRSKILRGITWTSLALIAGVLWRFWETIL